MNETAVFQRRRDLSPAENVSGFVDSARRQLTVFGADLDFNSNVWDVTDAVDLKGRGKKRVRVSFYRFSVNNKRIPFPEPYASFAKAYYRYTFGLRPKKFVHGRLYALKAVEKALSEQQRSTVEQIDSHTFDIAVRAFVGLGYDAALAYRVGGDLEQLADFLAENTLTNCPIQWRNPLPRPKDTDRVGKEFDERRASKMPSEAALSALPKAFLLASKPIDLIASSIAALCLAAPNRINEILMMPTNCEVHRPFEGDTRILLRWWPAKGAPPTVKPIYSGMSEVVKTAIANLARTSEPARRMAAWYEQHPDTLYLPPGTEHLQTMTRIGLKELSQVIGCENAWQRCRDQGLDMITESGARSVSFRAVERKVIAMLPPGFPFVNKELGLRYSNSLLIVRKNELHAQRSTYLCMIEPVPTDTLNLALGAKDRATIFDRFGFKESDGSKIKVTTHQFRHYLNTIAQMGGLSEFEIAKWSGRVDTRQNNAYNHVSADEMLLKIREAVGDDSLMYGPLGHPPDRTLITRNEFAELKVPTAHITELGYCIHDFTMAPCELHRDCINCEELVCMKWDKARKDLRLHLRQARELLKSAESAEQNGQFGANRWVTHQKGTVERLTQLCAILDDPTIPVGSFITLAPPNPYKRPQLVNSPHGLGDDKQLMLKGHQ
jgi:hypothetical protein